MRPRIKNFLGDEQGQDLIEYTLLVGFVCLSSAAITVGVGGGLTGMWTSGNTMLNTAAVAAS